jgi:hypothetical protein
MSISDDNLAVVPLRGSSLHRTLAFLNDKSAPLQITDARTIFLGKRAGEPITSTLIDHQIELQVKASQPVSAARARILYFDTFNTQLQSQPVVWQRDLRPGAAENLTWGGKVDTGRLANLLTIAVFFDQIRMVDGSVWVANLRESASQIRGLRLEPDLQ